MAKSIKNHSRKSPFDVVLRTKGESLSSRNKNLKKLMKSKEHIKVIHGTLVTMMPRRSDDSPTITPPFCAHDERFVRAHRSPCVDVGYSRIKLITVRERLPVFRTPNVTVFCHDTTV